jgi:hypothetical protein
MLPACNRRAGKLLAVAQAVAGFTHGLNDHPVEVTDARKVPWARGG